MQVDTIKAIATYAIALVIVMGGLVVLFATRNEVGDGANTTRVIIAGFMGVALNFVFGSEVQTRTARQAAASTYAAGIVNGVAARNEQAAAGQPIQSITHDGAGHE